MLRRSCIQSSLVPCPLCSVYIQTLSVLTQRNGLCSGSHQIIEVRSERSSESTLWTKLKNNSFDLLAESSSTSKCCFWSEPIIFGSEQACDLIHKRRESIVGHVEARWQNSHRWGQKGCSLCIPMWSRWDNFGGPWFNRHRWESEYCIAALFPIKNLLPNEDSISRRGSVLAVRHTKTTG